MLWGGEDELECDVSRDRMEDDTSRVVNGFVLDAVKMKGKNLLYCIMTQANVKSMEDSVRCMETNGDAWYFTIAYESFHEQTDICFTLSTNQQLPIKYVLVT